MKNAADIELTARVRRALSAHPGLGARPIHISVVSRSVRLAGHVPTSQERERAGAVALAVSGVLDVRNGLEVR